MTMKTALVIGGSGTFGGAVGRELASHGWHIRALRRPGGRPPEIPGSEQVLGSLFDEESLRAQARGASVIVHGFNVPYQAWPRTIVPAARIVGRVAALHRATVLFPGNVYGLGADHRRPLDEAAARNPPSRKGQLRNQVEKELRESTQAGARVIVLRAGDYMGAEGTTNWFFQMTKGLAKSNHVVDPSPGNVRHEWAYLPDLARAARLLLEKAPTLAAYEEFHFSSFQLENAKLIEAIGRVWGEAPRTRGLPWLLVTLLSPLWPMQRELREMRYLWRQPVLLDDAKLMATLPEFDKTPLEQAIRQCLIPQSTERASGRRTLGPEELVRRSNA
jgi:nucleoside-diphosphate-sugar epimerase